MERKFDYLINNRVIWRRDPVTDKPDIETDQYLFYKDGTYQCYNLFRSKAKITTYRSLKWHMLVLWHLNPNWNEQDAMDIAMYITDKEIGFITFNINKWIFKWDCGLTKSEKLSIVGQLIGKMNGIDKSDIYEAMTQINYEGYKIIISKLAKMLNVTPRTIYRHMNDELKQEKERLNEEI